MAFTLTKFVFVSLKKLLNFLADDHSRVVLTFMKDRSGSDYINANYIDVCIQT